MGVWILPFKRSRSLDAATEVSHLQAQGGAMAKQEEKTSSPVCLPSVQFAYTQTSMTETNFISSDPLFSFRQLGLHADKCGECNLERMIQCSPGDSCQYWSWNTRLPSSHLPLSALCLCAASPRTFGPGTGRSKSILFPPFLSSQAHLNPAQTVRSHVPIRSFTLL